MQVDDIRRLVKLVEESEIDELEVRRWWEVIRITKRARGNLGEASRGALTVAIPSVAAQVPASSPAPAAPTPVAQAPAEAAPPKAEAPAPAPAPAATRPGGEVDEGLVAIRSPMVGTFYRAPNPTAPPFVDVGASVGTGQVVCIVEAMKLMNEIESEVGGRVERVLVENGKAVEYNQPLFLVRPD